ncbi:ATP-binding protein [Marinobacter arenosus]|uniref:ATP-binding protein n=1 Tax=Marinobacter arenosus TaxID=2856822 RepID=UPI001C4BCFA1|nr:hypothetical protein [Marinobacter arenosus]MBW0147863.1 hypothetical protein [Marinobacter arenosus]
MELLAWRALEEAFLESAHGDEMSAPWELLRKLYDIGEEGKSNQVLCHALGLPRLEEHEAPDSEINNSIANFIRDHGFSAGISQLQEDSRSEEVGAALESFKKNAIYLFRTPQEYVSRPLGNYSKACQQGQYLDWWNTLSQAVWLELLSQDNNQDVGDLKVTCTNALFRPMLASQLPVVYQSPRFLISVNDELIGEKVLVYRSSGRKKAELIEELTIDASEIEWEDDSPLSDHEQYLCYEFVSSRLEKPTKLKLVALDSYLPGVVLNCRSAQKLTPFKKKRSGRKTKTKAPTKFSFDSELVTNGIGTHTVEFFYRTGISMPSRISGHVEDNEDEPARPWPVTTSDKREGYAVAVLEISADCTAEFELDLPELEESIIFRIHVSTSEFAAEGAKSEFDKFVTNNCTRSTKVGKVDVKQTMLTQLEQWILDCEASYLPLIIGAEFKEVWQPPIWEEYPRLSSLGLAVDPRPRIDELTPPAGYIQAREEVRLFLKSLCDEKGCTIEALSLGQLMQDENKRSAVERYIGEYADWLTAPDSLAAWADLITVHEAQTTQVSYLKTTPVALLLSPLHPIRLAWQCHAQHLLQEAIQQGLPCPVAGVIEPSSFPDCMSLKCRDVNGQFKSIGFASVKSSSDYWSVLWRADAISEVNQGNGIGVFGEELGLKVEGMVTGFNKQQVKRSLDEIRQLYPAKARLRISLHSDSSGYSSCNEGIDEWCLENLGPDVDEWSSAGGLTLQVIDMRPKEEQLEPAALASLTERSGTQVRWYTNGENEGTTPTDLSIVDHLQTMDQEFREEGVRSPVDPSCVSRISIKKNATEHRKYLSLSRAGSFVNEPCGDQLLDNMSRALSHLELTCVTEADFDSLGFAPNLQTLNASLENTRYCAISSSAVDATCFHSTENNTYLWDYELPRYAPGAGQACGFYLVAKQSPTMFTAMTNILGNFVQSQIVTDEQVGQLLDEISRRGIPTLKRLTSGGSASLGEAGMLIASRLLQTDFQVAGLGKGLIPAIDNGRINLVIPADVFQPRFDELRKALDAENRERPDLLVLSIAFGVDDGDQLHDPKALKVTPIEVKTRTSEMTDKQRGEAVAQATSFADFLISLKETSKKSALWGLAYRDLLASWLDYGFRVYGETDMARRNPHWVSYHQSTIAGLMSGQMDVELDPIGRLVSIEKTSKSRAMASDASSDKNIVILSFELAGALLTASQSHAIDDISEQINDWNLLIESELHDEVSSKGLPEPSDSGSNNNAVDSEQLQSDLTGINTPINVSSSGDSKSENDPIPLEGLHFKIGQTTELIGNKDVEFYPGNTALNNINIGVVGDLGTGKTQLLKSLVYQMVKNPQKNRGLPPKILILDYKRDFSDVDDDCRFIEKAKVKIVSPYKIPLNLFSTSGDSSNRAMLDKIGFFRDILRKIFSVSAPVQDKNLKDAIKSAYRLKREENGRDPTIYDVLEQYDSVIDGKPDSVSGIISDLVDYEIFEDDPNKIVSFNEFFDGVIAIDLKDLSDDKLKKMVIVIFLNLYYDYMLKVEKKPFVGTEPQTRFIDSYLLVDEAHNIMPYEFEVLSKLLLQGRAFGIGVILASQYFSHFKNQRTDYREPIQSWFIHQVPGVTARDLDKIGIPSASDNIVNRISGLKPFHSLCKTLGWEGEFIKAVPFYSFE